MSTQINILNANSFTTTGSVKTIYIAEDTDIAYYWTGSAYQSISIQDFATVREVQIKLCEKGFFKLKICSGLYLNETFDAVKEFQKKNKLPLTGIVDERTYKMIMA